MKQGTARQSERVDYRVPVALCARPDAAPEEPECPQTMLCETLNVGVGGMAVCGPLSLSVGDTVECRMVLDGEPRRLPGRVAWADGPNDTGPKGCAGIRFEALSGDDTGSLQAVVQASMQTADNTQAQDPSKQAVWLHFDGVEAPVRVRATPLPDARGWHVRARLPLLTKYAPVRFQREGGAMVDGYVGAVAVSDQAGTPELSLEIERVPTRHRRKRSRRHAMYSDRTPGYGRPQTRPGRERTPTAPMWTQAARGRLESAHRGAHRTGSSVPAAPSKPARRAWVSWVAGALVPLLLGVALVALGWRWRPPAKVVQSTGQHSQTERVVATALSAPIVRYNSSQNANPVSHPNAPQTPSGSAPTLAAPDAHPPTQDAPATAPGLGRPNRPKVTVGRGFTRVWLPLVGDMRDVTVHKWKEPLAIAVSLPNGKAALASRTYRIGRGGVGRVTIGERNGVGLVRVLLESPVANYEAVPFQGGIEVQLEHVSPRKEALE